MPIVIVKSNKCFAGVVNVYEHYSLITKTKMRFSVFLPSLKVKAAKAMIWLSGLTCNEDNFIFKAGALRFAAEQNILLICPDTSPRGLNLPGEHESWDFGSGAGFYVTATTPVYKEHYNMYDYINGEIYQILLENFKISKNSICISGHSMGGHGALIIGLKNPEKYYKISAFSPIVNPINCPWGQKAFIGYLGNDNWANWDATELVSMGYKHPTPIVIEQGTADEFWAQQLLTDNFRQACDVSGQVVKINYRDGYDHSYFFITTFIQEHIY